MNNLLHKSINRIENKNLVKNKFDKNKFIRTILNLNSTFNKYYSFTKFLIIYKLIYMK